MFGDGPQETPQETPVSMLTVLLGAAAIYALAGIVFPLAFVTAGLAAVRRSRLVWPILSRP
jgi:hypothetical protein